MKHLIMICLLTISSFAFASKKTGVGVSLGNPTGLAAKHWLNNTEAVDAGLGWSIGRKFDFSLHSDFLKHKKGTFVFNDVHPLDFYYGIGGRMEFGDDFELGARIPLGLAHEFQEEPIDVFAEVAPIIDFIGKTGFELHILIGGRYYF